MRDGISIAKQGIPAVALITETFWAQGDFMSRSLGMPDLPRLQLPHPVAGSGTAAMADLARRITPSILSALTIQLLIENDAS